MSEGKQVAVLPAVLRFVVDFLNTLRYVTFTATASTSAVTSQYCASSSLHNIIIVYFVLILYYDQHLHNYFTNYHTATCFDTIVSSSGSL
jgi:hypothetical protein